SARLRGGLVQEPREVGAELADVLIEALGHLRRHRGRRDLEVDVADALPTRKRHAQPGPPAPPSRPPPDAPVPPPPPTRTRHAEPALPPRRNLHAPALLAADPRYHR